MYGTVFNNDSMGSNLTLVTSVGFVLANPEFNYMYLTFPAHCQLVPLFACHLGFSTSYG